MTSFGQLFSDASGRTDPTIKRQTQRGAIPPLRIVEDFMLSLTSPNSGLSQIVLLPSLCCSLKKALIRWTHYPHSSERTGARGYS
jgi:hypothetical protein